MDHTDVDALKKFVEHYEKDNTILQDPSLSFFASFSIDFLLGWQTHGFKLPGDLTSDQVKTAAKQGWLTNEQYLAILLDPEHYSGLRRDDDLPRPLTGQASGLQQKERHMGLIFLCRQEISVGEKWPVSKVVMQKVNGFPFLHIDVGYTVEMEGRVYTTTSKNDYAIHHYFRNEDPEQIDRAEAQIVMRRVGVAVDKAAAAVDPEK